MGSTSVKRRSKNIPGVEKARLIEIMKKNVNIIENKKHDTFILEKKKTAWEKIQIEFNAEASCPKTLDQLKIMWKDLKAKAKKEKSRINREKIKTGGGIIEAEIDDISQMIVEIIPQVFDGIRGVVDDDNVDDTDGISNKNNDLNFEVDDKSHNSSNTGDKSMKTIPNQNIESEEVDGQHDILIEEIRRPHSPIISDDGRKNSSKRMKRNITAISRDSSSFAKSSNFSNKANEFHNLKMKLLQEEHNEKMMLIRRQKETLEEEHCLKVQILNDIAAKINKSSTNEQLTENDITTNDYRILLSF